MMRRLLSGFGLSLIAMFGAWSSGCAGAGEPPPGGVGGTSWSGAGGGGGSDAGACIAADGHTDGSDRWSDPPHEATVSMDDAASCARSYALSTTQPRVDDLPASPRTVDELGDAPVLRSGHDMFDALHALALDEVRQCSVESISDGAFNGGNPVPCPAGGCFETGRKWTYVWTRDTSYALHLGLAHLDPLRAKNSLAYKLSERRGGGDLQIVQDTGSGGSYPISTDRVVWALGAWALLPFLDGAERQAFLDQAYEAIANTAEHDRRVVFDASDGLYRGEQSFLDWREQSYPAWVASDTAQIGMSKSLSTNVGHLRLLEVAAALAMEKGLASEAAAYGAWASALKSAIATRFWMSDDGMFSSFATTFLDQAPTHRYDLLGGALAVLAGVGDDAQRQSMLASYPHLDKGAAVIWPQQQDVPIYHNRGIWPFVTALWIEAAKREGNAAVVSHGARSLIRGAALNLSNMENFELVTGAPWLEDGAASGPVVNSQRQLWSVAGFVSLVHKVIFGLEANGSGVRFVPFVPRDLRNTLFAGATRIALSRLPYKGGLISVALDLGAADGADSGALVTASVRLNGVEIDGGFVADGALTGDDVFEIALVATTDGSDAMKVVSAAEVASYQNVFGPRTPALSSVGLDGAEPTKIGIGIDVAGESGVLVDVYRDGVRVAQDLPGTTSYWVDASSTPLQSSHCYSVETRFVAGASVASGTRSQHAKPVCFWGTSYERIHEIDATQFTTVGGTLVDAYGKWHHEGWGDSGDSSSALFTPATSGDYLVQLEYGNGAGPFDTGITCALKLVEVSLGGNVVASGYLAMPHLGSWDQWRGSTFLPVSLDAGAPYTITVREDGYAINMSERAHFTIYGGSGGSGGRFNRANIATIKLLARTQP